MFTCKLAGKVAPKLDPLIMAKAVVLAELAKRKCTLREVLAKASDGTLVLAYSYLGEWSYERTL